MRCPASRALTRRVVERASTVIAVSDYLRRELELKVPEARGKTVVIDSGVDLERFAPATGRRRTRERPAFVAVGSLTERKNPVRLADAFATLGRGSLVFVGDGPLRPRLEGRERVRLVGRVPHDAVPGYLAAADVVCAPSLLEPFGQSILEAMAAGKTVVATRVGGPPEFVPPEAGILVDPLDRGGARARARGGGRVPGPERGGARGGCRARRQASGGAGGGGSPSSRSRSASLSSTRGRTCSSSPASRASSSACS